MDVFYLCVFMRFLFFFKIEKSIILFVYLKIILYNDVLFCKKFHATDQFTENCGVKKIQWNGDIPVRRRVCPLAMSVKICNSILFSCELFK